MVVVSKTCQGLNESCLATVSQQDLVCPENVASLNIIISSTETSTSVEVLSRRVHHTSRGACQTIRGVLLNQPLDTNVYYKKLSFISEFNSFLFRLRFMHILFHFT